MKSIIYTNKRNKSTNNKSTVNQNVTKTQKYARTGYIRRLYRAKHIINRFPNMKSIMYTNKSNKSSNNKFTITKNVDEKPKICPDGLYSSFESC